MTNDRHASTRLSSGTIRQKTNVSDQTRTRRTQRGEDKEFFGRRMSMQCWLQNDRSNAKVSSHVQNYCHCSSVRPMTGARLWWLIAFCVSLWPKSAPSFLTTAPPAAAVGTSPLLVYFSASMALVSTAGYAEGFLQQEVGNVVSTTRRRPAFVMFVHQTPPPGECNHASNGEGAPEMDGENSSANGDTDSTRHAQRMPYPGHYLTHDKKELDDGSNSTFMVSTGRDPHSSQNNNDSMQREVLLQQRVTQLEGLVAKQAVDIKRLQEDCRALTESMSAFSEVIELLRASAQNAKDSNRSENGSKGKESLSKLSSAVLFDDKGEDGVEDKVVHVDVDADSEIFGKAPSSVMEAADAAGAAILAAMLGGQQRLLVDVRESN